MRVLVVDDEPLIVEILSVHLEAKGHSVVSVTDGSAALAAWIAEPFDVLVSDVRIPGLSGIDLLREIRAMGDKTPCLLITGHMHPALLTDKPDLQPARLLTKPFSFGEFEQELDSLFAE